MERTNEFGQAKLKELESELARLRKENHKLMNEKR
jgi:hypothetical protein